MIRYHTFATAIDAATFLQKLRQSGGFGYMLCLGDHQFEVREVVDAATVYPRLPK